MKKKILSIMGAVILAVLLILGYQTWFGPKTVEGSKEIVIEVIVEKENIDSTYTFKTDHEILQDLLEEKEEELKITFISTDYGPMIAGMEGYVADTDNQEYYHIFVNGENAVTGASEIVVHDEDEFIFELKTW